MKEKLKSLVESIIINYLITKFVLSNLFAYLFENSNIYAGIEIFFQIIFLKILYYNRNVIFVCTFSCVRFRPQLRSAET